MDEDRRETSRRKARYEIRRCIVGELRGRMSEPQGHVEDETVLALWTD